MSEVAQLMPNGQQTFIDGNGVPFLGGKVYMYVPNTSTFKTTWQDQGEATPNANPVVLDSAGRCVIFGNGQYRQVLKDQFGNTIWDKLVNWVPPATTQGSFYDLPVYIQGKPTNGETFPIFNAVRNVKLPATLTGTVATIAPTSLPTATLTCTLFKNGASIGTIAFATSGAATITFVSDVTFGAGDQLTIGFPATADATGGNIAITLVFTVL